MTGARWRTIGLVMPVVLAAASACTLFQSDAEAKEKGDVIKYILSLEMPLP